MSPISKFCHQQPKIRTFGEVGGLWDPDVGRRYGGLTLIEPWFELGNKSESIDFNCRTCDSNNRTGPHYFQLVHVPKNQLQRKYKLFTFLNSLKIILTFTKNILTIVWAKHHATVKRVDRKCSITSYSTPTKTCS